MLSSKVNPVDYQRYLVEWRDITMLRLFEAFLEAGPQVTLQLYVLTSLRRFSFSKDWLTIVSAVCSVVSLAWAVVSYSHALRLCCRNRGLSVLGYICQTCYRLCMVTSRVVVLVLFASQYKEWIFAFVCLHWGIMTVWLSAQETQFCPDKNETKELCLEKCFAAVMAVVYIFCFMNIRKGETRRRVTIYYALCLVENALLVGLWFPRRNFSSWLSTAALSVVIGGYACGLAFMLIYYQCLHPGNAGDGLCSCCCCCPEGDSVNASIRGSESTDIVPDLCNGKTASVALSSRQNRAYLNNKSPLSSNDIVAQPRSYADSNRTFNQGSSLETSRLSDRELSRRAFYAACEDFDEGKQSIQPQYEALVPFESAMLKKPTFHGSHESRSHVIRSELASWAHEKLRNGNEAVLNEDLPTSNLTQEEMRDIIEKNSTLV